MRLYYFVMLKKGPNRSQDSAAVVKLQAGHMAAIERNAANGKLILAGPMGDDGDLRGLFFFKTATIEEAKALVEQDPMVKAGRLTYEIHPWWTMEGKLD